MNTVSMLVSVPFCSLRKPYSREFLDTETVPPPSTVYGFLLSYVGEEDRTKYVGTRIACVVVSTPLVSTVLRSSWRMKNALPPGVGSNTRPDYQRVLYNLVFGLYVKGELAKRLYKACQNPESVDRFGVLSFGESTGIIDSVKFSPEWPLCDGQWLTRDDKGEYSLSVWADHANNRDAIWGQFNLVPGGFGEPPGNDPRWVKIERPS